MMIRLFEGGGVLCQGQGAKVVQVGCDHNATSRTYAALVLRDQQQRAFLVFFGPDTSTYWRSRTQFPRTTTTWQY